MTLAGEPRLFLVELAARNVVVMWPSPIWWRFWEKVERRMGYRVRDLIAASSQEEAEQEAIMRLDSDVSRKAINSAGDPYRIEVEAVRPVERAPADLEPGQRSWFSESTN